MALVEARFSVKDELAVLAFLSRVVETANDLQMTE